MRCLPQESNQASVMIGSGSAPPPSTRSDGSFSERTRALSVSYPNTNYKDNITTTQDDLNAWIERVHRAGIQVNCHANGDVAVGMYLTAFERAQKLFPRTDPRPKITHCTLITDELVRRITAVNAVPALF